MNEHFFVHSNYKQLQVFVNILFHAPPTSLILTLESYPSPFSIPIFFSLSLSLFFSSLFVCFSLPFFLSHQKTISFSLFTFESALRKLVCESALLWGQCRKDEMQEFLGKTKGRMGFWYTGGSIDNIFTGLSESFCRSTGTNPFPLRFRCLGQDVAPDNHL